MTRPDSDEPLTGLKAPDFSLELTLDSGQVFHWLPEGAGFVGTIGDTPVYVEQRGDELFFAGTTAEVLTSYFGLDHPLSEIIATFPDDPAMREATTFCRGMRLMRQPKWECLAAFITSAMKQVAHIRQMSLAIRQRWGKPVAVHGRTLWTYPAPEILAQASESELRECKLGFRAKNLLGTAQRIASGEVSLEEIANLPDEEARQALCTLPGVGEKVANCVLLFAYGRPKAFPIDVWIERILRAIYFPRARKVTTKRLKSFSAKYFGPHSGYAQQYLFHHARKTWRQKTQA